MFEALFLLGVLVGAFQILIAVFKLGDLTRYISESVILGFLLSAAILIALGQLGNALGVKDQGNGRQSVLKRTYLTLFHGDAFNYRALIISTATVVLAIVLRRLVKRFGLPQLDLLAVLIFAALIAYLAGWSTEDHTGKTAVTLTAKIPQSLPLPHIPSVQLSEVGQLSEGALAIAFIGLLEALSIAKAIAYQSGQKIDYNRQIIAEGLANLTGGFFQALPGSGSVTRSPINYQAGAVTRFSGVIASIGVADSRAVVRAAIALHAAGRAGRTAADHRRKTDRHQAIELRHQGVALRRGTRPHHGVHRRAGRPGHRGAARRCPVDPAVRAAGGEAEGQGVGGGSGAGGPREGARRSCRPVDASSTTSRASSSSVPHPNSSTIWKRWASGSRKRTSSSWCCGSSGCAIRTLS